MNHISMSSSVLTTNSWSLSKFEFSHFCRLFLILLDSCWHSLLNLYLPYLKFARGFWTASAQAQFYTQRSRIHLSALWRRWTCSTNKTKTSPVLCSSAASKHTQRTHVYVRESYRLLFISIPVPSRSFAKASQNPPAKLYLKPKGVYAWNFFYEENLCSY